MCIHFAEGPDKKQRDKNQPDKKNEALYLRTLISSTGETGRKRSKSRIK
jgi:hypothetical protein